MDLFFTFLFEMCCVNSVSVRECVRKWAVAFSSTQISVHASLLNYSDDAKMSSHPVVLIKDLETSDNNNIKMWFSLDINAILFCII